MNKIVKNLAENNKLPLYIQASREHFCDKFDSTPEYIKFDLLYKPKCFRIYIIACIWKYKKENGNFNNVLILLDVKCFPKLLKENTQNFKKLMELIDQYSPVKYYPNLCHRIKTIFWIQIDNIEDVILFNQQFDKIFKRRIC